MYANSLLLCNKQDVGIVEVVPGRDFFMCENVNDMIEKSSYYLEHDEERIWIAQNGNEIVSSKYLHKQTLGRLFEKE